MARLTRGDREAQWARALYDLYLCGFITEPQEICAGVWAATHTGHGYRACAAELAAGLDGQVWPGKRSVSWVCGNSKANPGPVGRLLDPADVPKLEDSQRVLAALKVDCPMPWSTGRLARALMSWAVSPERCPANNEKLLEGISVGYHDCKPGRYTGDTAYLTKPARDLFDSEMGYRNPDYRPGVVMYDANSYYFNLLCRAPSPRVVAGSCLHWGRLTPDERARWSEMLSAVAEDKTLRNSIVGCAMGASTAKPVYQRDPERPGRSICKHLKLPGGPFRGLGLLIIRSAYELCNLAACEVDSVYSTIDSVTTLSGKAPTIWRSVGLPYGVKHEGNAEICRRGCWRVGQHETLPYKAGYRMAVPVDRGVIPERLYYKEWLQ